MNPLAADHPRYERARELLADAETRASDDVVMATLAQLRHEESLKPLATAPVASELSGQARQLENLVELGRCLDLRDGHCPLGASNISRRFPLRVGPGAYHR